MGGQRHDGVMGGSGPEAGTMTPAHQRNDTTGTTDAEAHSV